MNTRSGITHLALAIVAILSTTLEGSGESHWAFKVPQRPVVPQQSPEAGNAIDAFVRQGLESAGIAAAPRATGATLIRRLSFDLRGVPPSPAEVDAFVADASSAAYARLVDRFLASPQFGERMAQDWLDLARYADTSGYAADRTRDIWVYRDWVIDAINANMPFDRFTIEQLAGDLLRDATPEQRVATGFHRNAMQAKGNNPRKEEFRIKGVVDRLTATGRTWLGLSLECAECHDHKFDPISQHEYYQLFAIFNNVPHLGEGYGVHGPRMRYLPSALGAERDAIATEIATLGTTLGSPKHESLIGAWDAVTSEQPPEKFQLEGDFTITAEMQTGAEVGNIVSKYDWRAGQRSFVFGVGGEGEKPEHAGKLFAWVSAKPDPFDGIEIYSSRRVDDGRRHHVAVVFRAGHSITLYVDGVADTGAKISGKAPTAICKSTRALTIGAGYERSPTANAYAFAGELHDVRLYASALAQPAGPLAAIEKIAKLRMRLRDIDAQAVDAPVMEELPEPRETHVLLRGDFQQRGDRAEAAVPAFLPPLAEDQAKDRLAFARWLVDGEHPLTARVAVNYLWQHFFGTGIVATPGDFGHRGAAPTHPELLDWLAAEFVASGWDRKHLVRLIVNSQAYQRTSARPVAGAGDTTPLQRMPRRRLAAEQIRDNALAVSGLLRQAVGGPSVFPPQPAGFYEERGQNTAANSDFTWVPSLREGRHRKTLYTYWKRMALHPSLAALDAPPRQVCIVKRTVTNTPQQALVLLNDPMFHECAEAFGQRIVNHDGAASDRERIDFAFRCGLGRAPEPAELERCFEFVAGMDGDTAWRAIAAALLNLDEALTIE